MSQNLQLLVQLSAMDKLTAPLKSVAKQAEKLSSTLSNNKKALKELEKTQNKMNTFKKMEDNIKKSSESIKKQTKHLDNLNNKIKSMQNKRIDLKVKINDKKRELSRLTRGGIWSSRASLIDHNLSKLTKEYEKLNATISKTRQQRNTEKSLIKSERTQQAKQLLIFRQLRQQLKASGVDVKSFAQSELTLAENIAKANSLIDKQREKLERLNQTKLRNEKYRNNVNRIKATSERLHNLGQRSILTGVAITTPVITAGNSIVGMTKTAGKFEKFNAVLEITEGSSEKAKKSFEWVKQFAVDTPANLDEAMEAFVKLRAYGLDPTNGLLKTLGDTSAAMGKPVMQAVEAIADAMTGENERLKEFGVRGSVIKGSNFIEYSYTDKLGKQQVAKINKNNRKEIEQTLTRIFNEKYAGAMEKQAKTLLGMWAKLEDHWTNFQMMVMQTGAFDWIKNKIQSILDQLDKMNANGELQKWAEDIGLVIKEVIQGFWEFGKSVFAIIKKIAEFARHNKGAIATIVQWSAILGSSLTVLGAFSMMLSVSLYPVARLIYGIGHLTKLNQLLVSTLKKENTQIIKVNQLWLRYQTITSQIKNKFQSLKNVIKNLPNLLLLAGVKFEQRLKRILPLLKTKRFWINLVIGATKRLFGILRILFYPLKLLLGLFSPLGIAITAISVAGVALYKNWERVKSFFGGFWEGLKQGLAPVLEKFSPLGTAFGVVVGWLEKAVQWITDLFTPADQSAESLEAAANWGKKFGEWTANAIEFALTPLTLLMDGISWVIENLKKIEIKKFSPEEAQSYINAIKPSSKGVEQIQTVYAYSAQQQATQNLPQKWSGGYTGNGGKYVPAGIVHKGEYVMTKEATARLGIANLNRLNYGSIGAMATLASSVAIAQPQAIQVDNRPPIATRQHYHTPQAVSQNVQITIHASPYQNEIDIARQIELALRNAQLKANAKMRSKLQDRG